MKKIVVQFGGLIAMMLMVGIWVGCGASPDAVSSSEHAVAAAPCAECETGNASGQDFWCESCGVGFVDGQKVKCNTCYQGKTGETVWCEKCNKGFVDGKPVTCKGCVEAAKSGSVCEACKGKKDAASEGEHPKEHAH